MQAPLSSRTQPTGTFGQELFLQTARTRTNDTDEGYHPIKELIDDIELNSLINGASSDTNTRDYINNEKGARD